MKCKKEFKYDKAIIIESDMLIDLDKEIKKLCNNIKYKAELVNRDEIEFESLEELIGYENSKDNYLQKISIWADDGLRHTNNIIMYIEPQNCNIPQLYTTVRAVITTDNIDKISLFNEKIEHLCDRYCQDKTYQFFSRTGIFSKLGIASWGIILGYLVAETQGRINVKMWFDVLILIPLIYLLLVNLIGKYKKRYYPPIVFYIGDGIKNYNELKSKRSNFFWTVCIGGSLTIIVGIIGIIFSIM